MAMAFRLCCILTKSNVSDSSSIFCQFIDVE